MTSSRFAVRQPSEEDRRDAIRIHCDPRTNQFRPGGAPTEQEASSMFDRWLAYWHERGFGYWAITDSEAANSPVIGFGGIMEKMVAQAPAFNLYFRLDPSAQGLGVAQFVGKLAFREAFDSQGAKEVLGVVRQNNHPSRRALERLGMQLAGSFDDHSGHALSLIYKISRAEYAAQRAHVNWIMKPSTNKE